MAQMIVWLERDRHHRVERQQLNYRVGPVGDLLHLAISVPGMIIIFLAKARTSPPKYPTNTTSNSPIYWCFRSDWVSCASHICEYVVLQNVKLCHLLVWISCHSISCSWNKPAWEANENGLELFDRASLSFWTEQGGVVGELEPWSQYMQTGLMILW